MDLVTYEQDGDLAILHLDDGKANVFSPAMIDALNAALDRAEEDGAIVVIHGRPGVLSGGFDLKVFKAGGMNALTMMKAGFEVAGRLLAFPRPVVAACTGHAMAMGAFLLLSCDYRVAAAGDFRIQANEVAIGLTMPHAALAICRGRLSPRHFDRAVLLSEAYGPEGAIDAGLVDRVVAPDAVLDVAREHARSLAALDAHAHAQSKLRVRGETLKALKKGTATDMRELTVLGVKRMFGSKKGGDGASPKSPHAEG